MRKQFFIMNKDNPVLSFAVEDDKFGQPVYQETKRYTDKMPFGYKNIRLWLRGRRAPSHRAHIERLLTENGCNDLETYMQVTHAVSLNDTFWVKAIEDGVTWSDVSPYRNDFDDVIANMAFAGASSGEVVSAISPEFTTDGAFAKCWVRENSDIFLLKRGSEVKGRDRKEPYSEMYASDVAGIICKNSVPYEVCEHHDKIVSRCPLFTSETEGYVSYWRFTGNGTDDIGAILSIMEKYGAEDDFRRMLVLDALVVNTDRHAGNFGMMFDTDTMEIKRMAPVFDENRALLTWERVRDLEKDPEGCIKRYTPKIGKNFVDIAQKMLTDEIRADLKNMRGFTFPQDHAYGFADRRLRALEEIVNMQINKILGIL